MVFISNLLLTIGSVNMSQLWYHYIGKQDIYTIRTSLSNLWHDILLLYLVK